DRPALVGGASRGGIVLRPADRHLGIARLAAAAGGREALDDLGIRLGGDEAVADATSERGATRAGRGHQQRRRRRRQRVQPRVLDGEESAVVILVAALPELSDDGDRLLEHGLADLDRRPARADDVLVQVLTGADAEEEAAG